ncbi:hypothetical protein KFE94_10245 [bacterium SCSIO 12643]|nr:hypothetical protein KFE94_10245 [bacterium SCSIO 12643]
MRKVLIFTFITIFSGPAFSQKYGEVGLFVGSSYYWGDVYSSVTKNSHLAVGLNYRQNFNSRWAWNFLFRSASISGDDQNSDMAFEQQRNLSFESNILEFGSTVEFNFLDFKPYKPQSYFQEVDVFTPYVFAGLSIFYHNPKAELAGNLYELKPFETEGVSYSRVVMAMPFGFGMKFRLSDRFLLGVSSEFRLTFTDYLDDVSTRYPNNPDDLSKTARDLSNRTLEAQGGNGSSWGTQRGNEYNNDWFSYLGITISYNLKKNPGTCHFNPSK